MAGLYLHVPFCARRCTYCDFYFVAGRKSPAGFVAAACVEIERLAARYAAQERIETIYLGGGTPSRLPLDDVAVLLDRLRTSFRADRLDELTVEVNPDDATPEYLRGLRGLGVDRLSIGIQSFFDEDLQWMNRAHDAAAAHRVVDAARAAGFERFSIDLIFGLPHQPMERWTANVARALELDVPHVSAYALTVETKTAFGKAVRIGREPPPDEETTAYQFRWTMDRLRAAGYEHYEISSYAKPGDRAVHNSRYWTHANYLGLGPGAHSFWKPRRLGGGVARRWKNAASLARYEDLARTGQSVREDETVLTPTDLANEYVMLRLRTSDGLDLEHLEDAYGADLISERVDEIAWLESEGLTSLRGGTLRLTDEGKLVADAVTTRLLLDEPHDPPEPAPDPF